MRIRDAAKQLGISRSWLRRLERQGRIPRAARDPNSHRRYVDADLEALRHALFGRGGAEKE
jgi:DNA-binding transcriptional MerR regulator